MFLGVAQTSCTWCANIIPSTYRLYCTCTVASLYIARRNALFRTNLAIHTCTCTSIPVGNVQYLKACIVIIIHVVFKMITFYYSYMYGCHNYCCMYETIKEPQLPKHERGLDVTLRVTRCAGRVSANTRPHHLGWGDAWSVGATWHACMYNVSPADCIIYTAGVFFFCFFPY